MKRILVICLAALMLLASLTGCRSSDSKASPSPIVSASPDVSSSPSPSGNVNDTDGIIDDAEDALEDAGHAVEDTVDDLVNPSPSVSPETKSRSMTR